MAPPVPLHSPSDPGSTVGVWTGREVVVAHASTRGRPSLEVAAYDPASNRWERVDPVVPPDHPPLVLEMVSVPDGVLLWSLWGRTQASGPNSTIGYAGVDVFRLAAGGHWSEVTGSWPQNHSVDSPVFTGSSVLLAPGQIWCGSCSHPVPLGEHAEFVDPRTLARTGIPPGPSDDLDPRCSGPVARSWRSTPRA